MNLLVNYVVLQKIIMPLKRKRTPSAKAAASSKQPKTSGTSSSTAFSLSQTTKQQLIELVPAVTKSVVESLVARQVLPGTSITEEHTSTPDEHATSSSDVHTQGNFSNPSTNYPILNANAESSFISYTQYVCTPVKIEKLSFWLEGYDESEKQFLENGFTNGFRIHYIGKRQFRTSINLKSAQLNPGVLVGRIVFYTICCNILRTKPLIFFLDMGVYNFIYIMQKFLLIFVSLITFISTLFICFSVI